MKVTIKKSGESKGLLSKRRFFTLSLWVDLTDEEKQAIYASNYDVILLEVKGGGEATDQIVHLSSFMTNSGPKVIECRDAFSAHERGEEFREEITAVAAAIKAYQAGDITREESFEL